MDDRSVKQAYRKLHTLRGVLDSAAYERSFDQTSSAAVALYRDFLSVLTENFSEIEDAAMADFNQALSSRIGPLLRFVIPLRASDLPWSLIPAFEFVLRQELGDDYGLLLRPSWEYNYSVYSVDLRTILIKILEVFLPHRVESFTGATRHIHVFTFPFVEKNNVVLNSVLGHEIGHFFHDTWRRNDGVAIIDAARTVLWETYNAQHSGELFEPYNSTENGIRILEGMFREIVSDIVGYRLFGPSMLYSLYYLSLSYPRNEPPSKDTGYYPPFKYRVRLLMDCVDADESPLSIFEKSERDGAKAIRAIHDSIRHYLKQTDDRTALQQCMVETRFFEKKLPEVLEYVERTVKQQPMSFDRIPILFEQLRLRIPINEHESKPVTLPEILMAGWLHYFTLLESDDHRSFVDDYRVLMRLLLKSIYSGYVHESFSSVAAEVL
jgi:hypothetical protein